MQGHRMKIFKLPDLGEGLQEAEIVEWHVKVGDDIEADQPLVSVETAKAIVEIPAPYAGRIAKLYGKPGDIAHLGAPLVGFEGDA
jgi:2-oxoisovalerate dehydrogenase E2 component (dihydrolipoyl transacylase)